jgi:branched-chain amino acid transport system ATP-binding protein
MPGIGSPDVEAPVGPRNEPVLAAMDVSHRFGGLVAVDGVSLDVYDRELVALIGANGAGKSTLINVIAGRYPCQEGDIMLNGESIRDLKAHQRTVKGVSRTFQTLRPLVHLTAAESVRLGTIAEPRSERVSVDHVLELFGLQDVKDQLPSQLTLSVQRRIAVARAYASSPKVMFLDEPSAGMNVEERVELGELIEQVREFGSSVVLVDHNLDLALGIADRVVVLDQGRVIAVGTPKEISTSALVQEAYLGPGSAGEPPVPKPMIP